MESSQPIKVQPQHVTEQMVQKYKYLKHVGTLNLKKQNRESQQMCLESRVYIRVVEPGSSRTVIHSDSSGVAGWRFFPGVFRALGIVFIFFWECFT